MSQSSASQPDLAAVSESSAHDDPAMELRAACHKQIDELKQQHALELKQLTAGYETKRRKRESRALVTELALAREKSHKLRNVQVIDDLGAERDRMRIQLARTEAKLHDAEAASKRNLAEVEQLDDQLSRAQEDTDIAKEGTVRLQAELEMARLILDSLDSPGEDVSTNGSLRSTKMTQASADTGTGYRVSRTPAPQARNSGIQARRSSAAERPLRSDPPTRRVAGSRNHVHEAPTVRPQPSDSSPPR